MHIRLQRPLLHSNVEHDENTATNNEIEKPGKLLAQELCLLAALTETLTLGYSLIVVLRDSEGDVTSMWSLLSLECTL